jgi:hypothetical protein
MTPLGGERRRDRMETGGSVGRAPRAMEPRDRRSACARHDGRAADRALRREGRRAAPAGWPRAVRSAPRPRAQGSTRLRDRPRHQQLFRPLAPGRGDGRGPGSRRVLAGRVIVRHAGEIVADHPLCEERRQWITDRAHLAGLVGAGPIREAPTSAASPPALLRPLAEYEAVAGGRW